MEFKARALFSSHVAPAALAASAKTGRANAMARVEALVEIKLEQDLL